MPTAQAPPDDERSLREALDYARSYLEFQQHYQRIPGVQAAVFARGQVQLSAAFGLADVATGVPLTPQHLFRIASHSKTFTATAVMQLAEENRIRLDDTAATWVPELAGAPAGRWTVRELLNHAAGAVRDGWNGDFWQLRGEFPDREALLEVLRDPRAAVIAANDRFKYSNVGYGLLGLILEAVSGESFAVRVREQIAGRLGLLDLGAEYDPQRAADYAIGYTALSYADTRYPIEHVDTRALAPATGCHATAVDLVQYFAAHCHGDERLLTDAAKRVLQHGWWQVDGEKDARYGLGFSLRTVGKRTLRGHGGGYPGHITNSVFDPDTGLAVSVLTNCIDGPAQTLTSAVVALIDLAAAQPRLDTAADVAALVGRYASLWTVMDVAVLGGRPYLLHPTAADPTEQATELEVIDRTTLRVAGGSGYGSYGEQLLFDLDDSGAVRTVRGESGMTLWPIDALPLRGGPVHISPARTATATGPDTGVVGRRAPIEQPAEPIGASMDSSDPDSRHSPPAESSPATESSGVPAAERPGADSS